MFRKIHLYYLIYLTLLLLFSLIENSLLSNLLFIFSLSMVYYFYIKKKNIDWLYYNKEDFDKELAINFVFTIFLLAGIIFFINAEFVNIFVKLPQNVGSVFPTAKNKEAFYNVILHLVKNLITIIYFFDAVFCELENWDNKKALLYMGLLYGLAFINPFNLIENILLGIVFAYIMYKYQNIFYVLISYIMFEIMKLLSMYYIPVTLMIKIDIVCILTLLVNYIYTKIKDKTFMDEIKNIINNIFMVRNISLLSIRKKISFFDIIIVVIPLSITILTMLLINL